MQPKIYLTTACIQAIKITKLSAAHRHTWCNLLILAKEHFLLNRLDYFFYKHLEKSMNMIYNGLN